MLIDSACDAQPGRQQGVDRRVPDGGCGGAHLRMRQTKHAGADHHIMAPQTPAPPAGSPYMCDQLDRRWPSWLVVLVLISGLINRDRCWFRGVCCCDLPVTVEGAGDSRGV